MTYIELSTGSSSSCLTEIVLVGLEEFARLVGEWLGREGERWRQGEGVTRGCVAGGREERRQRRHAVDDTASTAGGAVTVVGRGVSAVRARSRGARLGVRGAEAAKPRRHLTQIPNSK